LQHCVTTFLRKAEQQVADNIERAADRIADKGGPGD
jgi:hypothetical protein